VRSIVVILATLSGASLLAQRAPHMTTGLPAGPFAVGFHREWVLDPSRVWERGGHLTSAGGVAARPIRMDVWYPSGGSGNCRHTTLRDFLYAQPPDAYFAAANAFIQKWDEDSLRGFAKSLNMPFDRLLSPESAACLAAPVRTGRYPLVIYSGGWYNRSPDNIALAEYLASAGYVVAEIPLFGAGLWTGDLSSNPVALETQVRDLETALGALTTNDWVDRTHVAAMGYSSGGIVALFLGSRHPLIDAVVGLDPSYGADPAKVLSSPLFSAEKVRIPVLTLRSGHPSYAVRDRSAVLTAMRFSDRYTADIGRSTHSDFGDDVVLESVLSLKNNDLRTTDEGIAGYRAVVSSVRLFLDGVLRGQPGALEALAKPQSELLRMTKTAAQQPTRLEFRHESKGQIAGSR
jgi:dienelactone hydrolase